MSALGRWLSYAVLGVKPPIRRRTRGLFYRGPARDPRYRAFVRQYPCAACGSTRFVEAAHTGPHGLGTKAPDDDIIPLCYWDHWGGPDSLHRLGPKTFQKLHGIRFGSVIRSLQAEWKEINKRRRS